MLKRLFKKRMELDVEIVNSMPQDDLDCILDLIAYKEVHKLKSLGCGAYGSVYEYEDYAIKVFNERYEYDEEDTIVVDGEILKALQPIEYIPRLYAIVENIAIIVEKIDGVTVDHYLATGGYGDFINQSFNTAFEEALKDVLELGYKPYDMHGSNVMIDANSGMPVIIDVGLFEKLTSNEAEKYQDRSSIDLRYSYPTRDAMYEICDALEPYITKKYKQEADKYWNIFRYPKQKLELNV